MSTSSARVTLRQLCQLGLPGPQLLPTLLPVLRGIIKADHAAFFYCDGHGNISNLFAERMLSPQAQSNFHDQHSDLQFREKYLQRVTAQQAVSRYSVGAQDREGAYHQDVLGPLDISHVMYAIVRTGSRVLGQLSLYRGSDGAAFSLRDEERLYEMLHYLGDALSIAPQPLGTASQEHAIEHGLAVFNTQGEVVFHDEHWLRLIRMAKGDPITPANALYESHSLPLFVQAVRQTVWASPQALHRTETMWGNFSFRSHRLTDSQGASAQGLVVTRLSTEPLQLAQGLADQGLSPKQREVAMLLAQGYSNQTIAQKLGVSLNTAGYHVKLVFSRLGVRDRASVGKALLGSGIRHS
jgi:DNA-binding CsgD family transcriptional regulator